DQRDPQRQRQAPARRPRRGKHQHRLPWLAQLEPPPRRCRRDLHRSAQGRPRPQRRRPPDHPRLDQSTRVPFGQAIPRQSCAHSLTALTYENSTTGVHRMAMKYSVNGRGHAPLRLRTMRILSILIFLMAIGGLAGRASPSLPKSHQSSDHKLPRVALLVEDADLEALLIAGFSGVETMGRAELPKAVAERLLTGGNLALIGAEVAVIVERSGDRAMVKVVQCESGATVVVLELPKMPVEETARWIVTRTQPLLGAVADPMRPRISLPGLRFVTDSAENRVTERAINLMLTARLQARGAVVLERWRMGDLVFEKSLDGHESPFWKAAQIIDGSVSTAGGKLIARVRIRNEAGTETIVQAEGGTTEGLADDVATRVIAGRWKTDVGATQATEADAFLTDAKWMLKHGLEREAWQATESALALGVANIREAEMLRVQAAAMCAYPDNLKVVMMRDGYYNAKAFAPAELPTRLAAATEAVLLARDYWNAYKTNAPPMNRNLEEPAVLGVRSL